MIRKKKQVLISRFLCFSVMFQDFPYSFGWLQLRLYKTGLPPKSKLVNMYDNKHKKVQKTKKKRENNIGENKNTRHEDIITNTSHNRCLSRKRDESI